MNLSPSFIITLEVIQAMRIYEAKDSKKKPLEMRPDSGDSFMLKRVRK